MSTAQSSSVFNRRTFNAGTRLFNEGDPGHTMFYVERGRIQIWRGTPEEKAILGHIEPGGIFGEMALVDQKPRMAHATALVDSTVLIIPEHIFRQKLKTADPFIVGLVRMLVTSVRNLTAELERLRAEKASGPAKD
jgi:CRP/FNR family transcriptional regulator, cyclic AMP receptor protein